MTESNELIIIVSGILAAINSAMLIYAAWKRLKPEVKKLEMEGDSELVEAANISLEGAKTSANMLLDRINELKMELEQEKPAQMMLSTLDVELRNLTERLETTDYGLLN
jgi:hypothetical protein